MLRAIVLALLYPILKSVWEGWSALAGKFPGQGIIPYLSSALAFFATFALLGWVLGTVPVRWLKKGVGRLWRHFILKRFSALEEGGGNGSWRGKVVLYAIKGRFGARERASVFSPGLVTADLGEYISVLLIAPPAGTCNWIFMRKESDLIWLTECPIQEYGKAFITLGNGADLHSFLPEEGQP